MSEHFAIASRVNPTMLLLDSAVSPAIKSSAMVCALAPDRAILRRRNATLGLKRLDLALAPFRVRWRMAIGGDSPDVGLNFPLIHFLAAHFAYSDKVFAYDLARGMSIAGDVPYCGTLTPRCRPAVQSLELWRADLPARNRLVLDRGVRSASAALTKECWFKTLGEVARGWITEPLPVTDAMLNSVALTPRYAIPEEHGGRAPKIRAVDDFRASGINDALSVLDANIPESMDVFLARIAFYRRIAPDVDLASFSLDFSHAYKHVPIRASSREFSSVVFANPEGRAFVANLRARPFGSRRAPSNWARVTEFSKWVLRNFFGIAIAVYVAHIHCSEPVVTATAAILTVKAVCALLGFILGPKKEASPNSEMPLLGSHVRVTSEYAECVLPDRKRSGILLDLENVLRANRLTPAQAAKLRGRLGFAQSLFFGRVGRALLGPIGDRQYSKAWWSRHPLGEDLTASLRWRVANLEAALPRRISPPPSFILC